MRKPLIYPFVAIVGQEEMKLALILNVINPSIGGVLIRGEKGTAKSTAVRALAEILPEIEVVKGCPFQLHPEEVGEVCEGCDRNECKNKVLDGSCVETERRRIQVVELPVGSTEDRVVGTIDIERALREGQKRIEPGLLASAHRGILYVDEVNLLDDHVVDVLLDSAAMGVNIIEREGISFSHPARFVLVGTMNPEEGELRPQLLDRFGLCVTVEGVKSIDDRVKVMERRATFDENPEEFCRKWEDETEKLVEKIKQAVGLYPRVSVDRELLYYIASRCVDVGVDGHRGDITVLKTAKTIAAFEERTKVTNGDVDKAVRMALPHRLRRQPFQDIAMNVSNI